MDELEMTVNYVSIGGYSLLDSSIDGHTVRIRTGSAVHEFPLREEVSDIRAPIRVRRANISVLDKAGTVQGEGQLSMKVACAHSGVWRWTEIRLKNAEEEEVGRLRFRLVMEYTRFFKIDENEPETLWQYKLSSHKIEASDVEGEGVHEYIRQRKDELVGQSVPDIDGAEDIPVEWLRKHGFRDARDYLVQLYLAEY